MVPFFAIVAGPILGVNLGELALWLTRPREDGDASGWLPTMKLGRLLGVVVLAALLVLAWPGWLNGPMDLAADRSSPRRVAWDLRPDPSLERVAADLAALREDGRRERVFNAGLDAANYCAWFAPGVRCFFDHRYNLFPRSVEAYAQAKAALLDKALPARDWATVFAEHQVDHVVVPGLQAELAFLLEPGRWRPHYADSRFGVFSWSGPPPQRRRPRDELTREWNVLAFGKVPEAYRAGAAALAARAGSRTVGAIR